MGQTQSKKGKRSRSKSKSKSRKKKRSNPTVSPLKDSLRNIQNNSNGRIRNSNGGTDGEQEERRKPENWMERSSDDTLRGVLQALDRMGLMRMCKVSVGISFSSTNEQQQQSNHEPSATTSTSGGGGGQQRQSIKNKTNNKKKNSNIKNRRSLHAVDPSCRWLTPYEEVIVSMSRSIEILALPDGQIPCFGFGDASSLDQTIFPFIRNRPCEDFDEVHRRYRFISQNVRFGSKSSIAPLIYNAIDQVQRGGFHYHILVIISDKLYTTRTATAAAGSASEDTASDHHHQSKEKEEEGGENANSRSERFGSFSFGFHSSRSNSRNRSQQQQSSRSNASISSVLSDAFVEGAVEVGRAEGEIKRAIVEASHYPLSIIFIGVGDDDTFSHLEETFCSGQLPGQMFSNFGFVNYTQCTSHVQNFEQRQVPFVYQILRLVAVHYASIEMLYQIMLKIYHEKCLQNDNDDTQAQAQALPASGGSASCAASSSERRGSVSVVGGTTYSNTPSNIKKKKRVSGMPRELVDADKSYKKMFSPLAAHIRRVTATSEEGEEEEEETLGLFSSPTTQQQVDVDLLLSPSIQASIQSMWSDHELSSPQMNSPLKTSNNNGGGSSPSPFSPFSPPSAPNYDDICKNLDSLGIRHEDDERGCFDKLKKKIKIKRKETIPPIFVCPITQEMMTDPVIAEDGYTYERKCIEEWTSQYHKRSPMTNQEMETLNLIPNYALRSAIREWQERHGG